MSDQRRSSNGKKRMKKKNIVTVVIVLIAVIAAGIFIGVDVIPKILDKKEKEAQSGDAGYSYGQSDAKTVTYNGKTYKYNDHLTNVLVLGVDKKANEGTEVGHADAGQSDAIYLVSTDRQTGQTNVFSIPRDTMTQIETFGYNGESLGTSKDHLSVQFGFGDGKHESCKLTKAAVENLFYGVPIVKYAALNMDCIQSLAELAGEVRVTVPNDSLEYKDPTFKKGAEVVLTPENTEFFVRSRDTDETQTAVYRSERQNAYIKAYKALTRERSNKDPGFLTDIYETLKPYMTTNMDNGEFVDLMEALVRSDKETVTIPGEGVATEMYDEYHVDDDALYSLVIEKFYIEETE